MLKGANRRESSRRTLLSAPLAKTPQSVQMLEPDHPAAIGQGKGLFAEPGQLPARDGSMAFSGFILFPPMLFFIILND